MQTKIIINKINKYWVKLLCEAVIRILIGLSLILMAWEMGLAKWKKLKRSKLNKRNKLSKKEKQMIWKPMLKRKVIKNNK